MSDASPETRSGCLTEAEVSQLQEAAPGDAPEDLARHLAGCDRCQARVLFGSEPRRRRRGSSGSGLPTPARAFMLLAVMLLVIVAFFITLGRLMSAP